MSDIPKIQRVISILWPSFLMAGAATIIFFTAFDPADLLLDASRESVYSLGFFSFWGLTASSCLLTCYFQRPCIRTAFQADSQVQARSDGNTMTKVSEAQADAPAHQSVG